MKTLAYTVDIESLFTTQDNQKESNDKDKQVIDEQGQRNKTALLKIVLPYIHSVYALHNRKCTRTMNTSTGCTGLLGLNPVDIDKKIDWIVNTDYHGVWSENYNTFIFTDMLGKNIKIWLNKEGKHVHTPKLGYSMTSFGSEIGSKIYGEGVQAELELIAKHCAKYKDDWK
tara:strand:- start:15691 stop:16203 length:513 start_codon:yes stop_codon:yes gene_type:complete